MHLSPVVSNIGLAPGGTDSAHCHHAALNFWKLFCRVVQSAKAIWSGNNSPTPRPTSAVKCLAFLDVACCRKEVLCMGFSFGCSSLSQQLDIVLAAGDDVGVRRRQTRLEDCQGTPVQGLGFGIFPLPIQERR